MASGSQESVPDAEQGEGSSAPLLPRGGSAVSYAGEEAFSPRPEPPTATITHKDSVYSFALFVPPLARRKHGTDCVGEVWLATALLVLTVTCQLALSQIAGAYITSQSLNFKVTLVRNEHWMSHAITPIDYAFDYLKRHTYDVVEEKISPPPKVVECCSSVDCIAVLPCCARNTPSQANERRIKGNRSESGKKKSLADNAKAAARGVHDWVFGSSGGIALCRRAADGKMDCSPPSYAYMQAWDELDTNGDGVWTFDEAEADAANLGCNLGLSPVEFFHSAVRGIIKDAKDTAENSFVLPIVPVSIEHRHAIPKPYFEWYKALIVVCVPFDVSRCGQLVQQGVFDGAIGQADKVVRGGLRGGIYDLDSALDFCQRMLRPNGICEQTLPHTYRLYRARVSEKCGSASYSVGSKYVNPYDQRDAMSIVQVTFGEHSKYQGAMDWRFQLFLALILIVWYVTLVLEFSRILSVSDLIYNFENSVESTIRAPPRQTPRSQTGDLSISSTFASVAGFMKGRTFETPRKAGALYVDVITRSHKAVCSLMIAVRIFLWWYMANVGTTFLLATFDYDDLLFNAVALAFIFDLSELLYVFLVSDDLKRALKDAETASYPTSLPVDGWKSVLLSRTFWGLVLIPSFVMAVLYYNMVHNTIPATEALDCACFQSGPHCMASSSYTKSWWDKYWQDTYPLAKLRASYLDPS
jgi:hypothetical protein